VLCSIIITYRCVKVKHDLLIENKLNSIEEERKKEENTIRVGLNELKDSSRFLSSKRRLIMYNIHQLQALIVFDTRKKGRKKEKQKLSLTIFYGTDRVEKKTTEEIGF
jgi:hypothetical protein